ncbi:MAG: hypothetical protein PHC44_04695 [Lutispora sp.]|nr:hypothetical protein [Lutispora sp.]
MNIKDVAQDFYDSYGYWPEQAELESYLEQNGYFDNEDIPNNLSHFDSARSGRSFLDHLTDEESKDDFFTEFKKLINEISKNAKQQRQHRKPSEHNLEILFMTLVFLNKLTLYFLLRYCHENEIYVDL